MVLRSVRVSGYTLFTGDDNETWGAGRNPKSWVLKANLDGSDNWTTIDSVADDATMQDNNYTAYDFEMDVPGTYRNFRFEVSEVVNGTILQLGELQLFYIGNTFPDKISLQHPTLRIAARSPRLIIVTRKQRVAAYPHGHRHF